MADKSKANEGKPEAEEPKTGTDVAVQQTGTDLDSGSDDDFFADAGAGLEDFSQADMLIPYVRILQALSKELQKNHAKYIKAAEQGNLVNSATRKLYDGEKGFYVVPVSFAHRYMAWRPNNGGPAYDMGDDASIFNSLTPDEKGQRKDNDGNTVSDSLQFFVMLVDIETGEYEMAVLNFSGSQAKKARGWISLINNRMERHPKTQALFRPAIWFYSYKLTTVPESNDQGSWYGFSIEEGPKVMDLTNGREIYSTAKELRGKVEAKEVKAAIDDDAVSGEAGPEKAF